MLIQLHQVFQKILRISVPDDFVTGSSDDPLVVVVIDSDNESEEIIAEFVRPDIGLIRLFFQDLDEFPSRAFEKGDFITGDSDPTLPDGVRVITNISGRQFLETEALEGYGPGIINSGDTIYKVTLFEPTITTINFDADDSDSDIDSEITVVFGDFEGPEDALNTLKAAIESEYGDSDSDSDTGFIVSDPIESDSEWYIQVNTNTTIDLSTLITTDPGRGGTNAGIIELREHRTGVVGESRSALIITHPNGNTSTQLLPSAKPLTDLLMLIANEVNGYTLLPAFTVTNNSADSELVFTSILDSVISNFWDIFIDHNGGSGDIEFGDTI